MNQQLLRVKSDDFMVSESEIDERIDDIDGTTTDRGDVDTTSSFESMTIVASVDGRLHGFDANNNKKWTSDSGGPLSSHHASGNLLDFSGNLPRCFLSLSLSLTLSSIPSLFLYYNDGYSDSRVVGRGAVPPLDRGHAQDLCHRPYAGREGILRVPG